MKTKIILILVLTALNINLVSARNFSSKGTEGPSKSAGSVTAILLAPVTPPEATFEDVTDGNPVPSSINSLAPDVPKEASFEDLTSGEGVNPASASGNQEEKPIEKGKTVHPSFPLPCDAKYGCSL